MVKKELENSDFRKSLYFLYSGRSKKKKERKKRKKQAASGCLHYIKSIAKI